MAIDREDTLKKAEKLLRQGRLDAAIAEYQRVVDEYPRDWNTANALGDCFYRAHQVDKAVEQFCRIADHFAQEGFYPKAGALYKKALKIKPDDEHALLQSAEIAIRQGILIEAKQHLSALAERRRTSGNAKGAAEVLLRIGTLDPDDLDARLAAARAMAATGGGEMAAAEFRAVSEALASRGRQDEALGVLVEAGTLAPGDRVVRSALAAAYAARGDVDRARGYAETAAEFTTLADTLAAGGDEARALEMLEEALRVEPGQRALAERLVRGYAARGTADRARPYLEALGDIDQPDLLIVVSELRARAGELDAARRLLARLLAREPHRAAAVADKGATLAPSAMEAALVHVESAADTLVLHGDFGRAAAAFHGFLRSHPRHVAALMRLVEICVDGDLDTITEAQAALADAYLAEGRGAEARVVAEDLVAHRPGEPAHVERLRRALVLSGEPDVEGVIGERVAAGAGPEGGGLGMDLSDDEPDDQPADPVSEPVPVVGAIPPPAGPSDEAFTIDADETPRTDPGASVRGGRDPFGLGPIAIDLRDILGDDLDQPGTQAASGEMGETGEVDLSAALENLAPHPTTVPKPVPASLDAVFGEFRDEVSRQSVADGAEQHYKVGLTYEEMGMVPEAMKEFEAAVRSPRLRFEAASRLGRLAVKRGQAREAIEWFERAAEAPAPTVEAGRTLLYDLGDTLEAGGETARALAVFLELQSDAGDFRDVARRVERLARVQAGG